MAKIAESTNKVTLIGKVVEISHREAQLSDGVNYIAGKVMVDTGDDNIIPVDFFQKEKRNDGKPNGLYASTITVVEEFRTVAKDGKDEADIVEISTGQLSENSYTAANGQFYRGFSVRSAFYNRKAGASPQNQFIISGIIMNIVEEIENELPTGSLLIDLLSIGWNNRGDVLRLVVEDEKGAAYIKNSLSKGDEVKLAGEIVVTETRKEKVEEVAFGDPIVQVETRTERKLLVTSASAAKSSSIADEDLQTILAEREGRLKKAEEKAKQKNAKTQPKKERTGFSL